MNSQTKRYTGRGLEGSQMKELCPYGVGVGVSSSQYADMFKNL